MKTENESQLEHLKKEFKEEALLFKARAEVAAEDVAEKLESKVVSIAEAIHGDKDPEATDYVEVLQNEADRVFRLQTKLLSFVEKVSDEPDRYCTERMKLLEGTLRVHLSELQGEYRELGNAISKHETDLSDKIASVSGAFNATRAQVRNDFEWSTFQEILDELRKISSTYQVMHGLALATERPIAAGMAWSHMRKIDIHEAEVVASIYHIVMAKVCTGKPIEPVVDQALDEWKQSRISSLKNASRDLVGDVTE